VYVSSVVVLACIQEFILCAYDYHHHRQRSFGKSLCVCMHARIHMCVCMHEYDRTQRSKVILLACIHVCIVCVRMTIITTGKDALGNLCVYVYMRVYIYIYIYIYLCVCVCVCVYVCVCVCIIMTVCQDRRSLF
jgi:hypothetical protein